MVREGSIRMMTVMMLLETSGPVRHVLNQIPAIHHFISGRLQRCLGCHGYSCLPQQPPPLQQQQGHPLLRHRGRYLRARGWVVDLILQHTFLGNPLVGRTTYIPSSLPPEPHKYITKHAVIKEILYLRQTPNSIQGTCFHLLSSVS